MHRPWPQCFRPGTGSTNVHCRDGRCRKRSETPQGMALWPGPIGVAVHSGDGGVKSVAVNLGTWNSLHTGDTGTDEDQDGTPRAIVRRSQRLFAVQLLTTVPHAP